MTRVWHAQVIVATAHDVANLPGVQEGVYVVGTGNTGAASTFLTLGVGYFLAMMTGALTIRCVCVCVLVLETTTSPHHACALALQSAQGGLATKGLDAAST